jgi:hypothetical protein
MKAAGRRLPPDLQMLNDVDFNFMASPEICSESPALPFLSNLRHTCGKPTDRSTLSKAFRLLAEYRQHPPVKIIDKEERSSWDDDTDDEQGSCGLQVLRRIAARYRILK